jgi:hypothetical protein
MWNGFLGTDASFMLDVVVCALGVVAVLQAISIYIVKVARNYTLHKYLQITLAVALLLTVVAFEVDMRIHGGWVNIINKNPDLPRLTGPALDHVRNILYIHLIFAVTTPLLWTVTLSTAPWGKLKPTPQLTGWSKFHKQLGWLSTIDLALTSATGIWFYLAAFVFTK